jgi:hypothetical protein
MKVQNWWVKKGLLTSGADPAPELSVASDQFPDEYVPMVFMTGDGHRHPPFEWSNRGVWKGFFAKLVEDNKICCHVETFADDVKVDSVPKHLEAAFYNQKVFGWEPEFYKIIQRTIETAINLLLQMTQGESMALTDINALARDLGQVQQLGYLADESRMAQAFALKAARAKAATVTPDQMGGYDVFLKEYKNVGMSLRTGINDVIGANIQRVIKRYPDHMHFITCGDAHIITNPLQRYIEPPIGTFGIADAGKA